jgi:MerR family transcriptional regulator, light-induced transcriptional regulator
MKSEIKYTIDIAAKTSGLTQNAIRTWENRYQITTPERTQTRRRLYTESDIERLRLLAQATKSGYKIGDIYNYDIEDLKKLLPIFTSETPKEEIIIAGAQNINFDMALEAVKDFNSEQLYDFLNTSANMKSKVAFINSIVFPFLELLGSQWKQGSIRIAQEHFASGIIKNFLTNMREKEIYNNDSPAIIVCTPLSQVHEIAALSAAVVIATYGWRVIYLGANLPSEEIIFSAKKTNAKVVALSIVYPQNKILLETEIDKIANYLPNVKVYIGSNTFQPDTKLKNIKLFKTIEQLCVELNKLQSEPK